MNAIHDITSLVIIVVMCVLCVKSSQHVVIKANCMASQKAVEYACYVCLGMDGSIVAGMCNCPIGLVSYIFHDVTSLVFCSFGSSVLSMQSALCC